MQDLGTACIELVKDAGVLQANPADTFSKKDVSLHARKVGEKVRFKRTYMYLTRLYAGV